MTKQENKKLMQEIFEALSQGHGSLFIESLADDICWTLLGTTEWSRVYHGKQDVQANLLQPLFSQFADRFTNTALRFVAEDDYVVVECQGNVTTRSGKPYNNRYCWVCRIADGKLKELTEYCDTQLVKEVLEAPYGEPN